MSSNGILIPLLYPPMNLIKLLLLISGSIVKILLIFINVRSNPSPTIFHLKILLKFYF